MAHGMAQSPLDRPNLNDLRVAVQNDLARDRLPTASGWRLALTDWGISFRALLLLMLLTFTIALAVMEYGLPRWHWTPRGARAPEAQNWIRSAGPRAADNAGMNDDEQQSDDSPMPDARSEAAAAKPDAPAKPAATSSEASSHEATE